MSMMRTGKVVSTSDEDSLSAADILDGRQRLDDELRQIKIAHAAANLPSEARDIEELQQLLVSLKQELLDESAVVSRNSLCIQRFQLGQALCDNLFSNESDYTNNAFVRRCLEELRLTSQLMRILEETTALHSRIQSQKMDNLKLKNENAVLMQKQKDKQKEKVAVSADAAKNKKYERLLTELKSKQDMVKISKHLGQLLVRHLDEDLIQNDWKDFLLKCGEPSDL